jgi:hypothetical protein
MNRAEKISTAALVALYAMAGTPLAAHAGPVGHAIERAIQVRAHATAAPGKWQTDRDGRSLPQRGISVTHIGGNGSG